MYPFKQDLDLTIRIEEPLLEDLQDSILIDIQLLVIMIISGMMLYIIIHMA